MKTSKQFKDFKDCKEVSMNERAFLDVRTVAKRLLVNPRTVTRLINRGELSAYRVGEVYRIDESDLVSYLEKSKVSKK
jgi:excisionase family DNA binding protein